MKNIEEIEVEKKIRKSDIHSKIELYNYINIDFWMEVPPQFSQKF